MSGDPVGFLGEFDAAAASGPGAGSAVFITWLRNDWRGMYGDLRANRPILMTPSFTVVTRATDVLDILAQPSLYSVRANRLPMDGAVGPFMLARDETELNWEEKGLMQSVLRWEDLPSIRTLAARTADEAIEAAEGSLNVVPLIARMVPLRIVQRVLGFDAADEMLLRWSFATQHGMFRNFPFDRKVLENCHAAGQEMQAWLRPFLAAKQSAAANGGSTAVERLLRHSAGPGAPLTPERVLSNVCGLLVGAIETMSAAIVQVVDQFLEHADWLQSARAADDAGDLEMFDAHVFEALRFNPITTFQFRIAETTRLLGPGTFYEAEIEAGTLLAVSTGSAMFDPALMPDPERFTVSRPSSSYLHFGLGHHECLGRHVGRVAIPEAVRRIIRLPRLRRAEDNSGYLDFGAGPFPEALHIAWDHTADAPVPRPAEVI